MLDFKMPDGPPVKFADWEFPVVPTPSASRPKFVDTSFIPTPQASKSKPFPEYAVIDPQTILSGIQSLSTSFDKGVGIARKFVPGVAGIGDILGQAGRAIEQSPIGAPLGTAGSALTGGVGALVEETGAAISRRVGQLGDELGKTFESPWNALSLPTRLAGTAALGETGSKLGRGVLDFSTAPRDILDSINLAGLVPAFKGAGMLIRGGAELGGVGRFAVGASRAFVSSAGAGSIEKAGVITGRTVLAISGAGLAADFTLPKLAPNEPWAQDILNNRLVAEDSPWRFPFEAATTLPMDLFAMTKLAKESKLASWAAEKVFGPPRLLSQFLVSDEAMANAIKGGLITKSEIRLVNDVGLRQYAEELIVKAYNESRFLRKGDDGFALTSKDLPLTQKELNDEVKQWVDKLYDTMGAERLHREAADKIRSIFGWDNLPEAQIITEFSRYARYAGEIEPMLPGRLVGVNTVDAFWQAPRALEVLDTMKSIDQAAYDKLIHDYPALSSIESFERAGTDLNKMKLALEDYRKFMRAEKDPAEIASIRAQIKDVEKNMDDIEKRFGREGTEVIFDPKTGTSTTRRPWDLLKKELTELEQRYAVLNAPSYFKLGVMQQELDAVAAKIIQSPTDALKYRYGYLQSQIKSIREAAAAEHLKTIKTKQALIAAREDAIRFEHGTFDEEIVDTELEILNEGLDRATEAYYNAVMAGSRWAIEHSPKGPIMRLVDTLPESYRLDPASRTTAGKTFDSLFGALPNKVLGREAWDNMRGMLAEGGSTEEGISKFFEELRSRMDEWSITYPNGYKSNAFVSIFHLPPHVINKTAENINKAAGRVIVAGPGISIGEVVYRSYPGPLKIFAKQALGKELPDVKYSAVFHGITRSYYPMLRFFLSPRFLALNLYEAKFIGGGLGGPQFFGEGNKWFERMVAELETYGQDTSYGFLSDIERYGYSQKKLIENIAKLAWTKRADEVVYGILDTVARRPEMEGVMKELGTREKWYDEMFKMFKTREAIRDARFATTKELKEFTEQIKAKTDELAKLPKGSGDELRIRAELKEITEKYDDAAAKEMLQKDAEAIYGADIAKYQPFLDAITYQFSELIKAERMAFMGNPNRSAMERLLNSFLLYWPLSYQLKASKLLADMMFSHGFGLPTGSSVAAAWGEIRRQHDLRMKSDPEYARAFSKNKDLLTFIRQFIPITPEDVGVTLSPFVRIPYHLVKRDYKGSPVDQLSRLYTVGPLHDTNLVSEIAKEQSRPGGFLHDIFMGEQ